MIFNLQELAIDFRNAIMKEISLKQVDMFLKEIQRIYSHLDVDDQIAAEELWVGYDGDGMVISNYHYDNFFPLVNLQYYLTKRKRQVKRLYSDLCGECCVNKISFEESDSRFSEEDLYVDKNSSDILDSIGLPF